MRPRGRFSDSVAIHTRTQEDFIDLVVNKMRNMYEEKKSDIGNQKKQFMTSKINFERKLEIAEEKLINGIIDDDVFTKIKSRYREQIEGVEDEMQKLDRTKNLKMDVVQNVLALMRDIGKTYEKSPDELKRLYLGLFWDQFKAEDKMIIEATKSPIVLGLETMGLLIGNTKQKPDPLENRAFATENITTDDSVIISPVRGAVVEDVRTIFEQRDDATIYIPNLKSVAV